MRVTADVDVDERDIARVSDDGRKLLELKSGGEPLVVSEGSYRMARDWIERGDLPVGASAAWRSCPFCGAEPQLGGRRGVYEVADFYHAPWCFFKALGFGHDTVGEAMRETWNRRA